MNLRTPNPIRRMLAAAALLLASLMAAPAFSQEAATPANAFNPIRLAYISGPVSFWRFGANDWVNAQINTPLAIGDALFTGPRGVLELQAEGRVFLRADADSQISVVSQTADFLQIKITSGRVSLDVRSFPSTGYVVELNTPSAAFTIDHAGYYRVDVGSNETRFTTRKGGRAIMSPASGDALTVQPSEEIVIRHNGGQARPETYVAPALDTWDRWNYDRTTYLTDATSERYLPPGVAGARDLDLYGSWRLTDEYGAVWVPDSMPAGWAPYSTGRWIWDPYYQWTWVDDAAWGWAPYHYGRWVYLGSYWAWAPGPVIRTRPVYAPALVGFYGVPVSVSVGLGFGGPGFGWVALGWGEPLLPWWGFGGFIGLTWWGGWYGPRIVNNVIVHPRTVVNVTNITYINSKVNRAIVVVPKHHFGNEGIHASRERIHVQERDLQRVAGEIPFKPNPASLNADAPRSNLRPSEQTLNRPVVAVRKPAEHQVPWRPAPSAQETRKQFIPAPPPDVSRLQRPAFGNDAGPELARPPRPPQPQFQSPRNNASPPIEMRGIPQRNESARPSPVRPDSSRPETTRPDAIRPDVQRQDNGLRNGGPRNAPAASPSAPPVPGRAQPSGPAAAPAMQNMPGVPANRVYREHMGNERPASGPSMAPSPRTERPNRPERSEQRLNQAPRGAESRQLSQR